MSPIELLKEIDEYLSQGEGPNTIGRGSILHRKIQDLLEDRKKEEEYQREVKSTMESIFKDITINVPPRKDGGMLGNGYEV